MVPKTTRFSKRMLLANQCLRRDTDKVLDDRPARQVEPLKDDVTTAGRLARKWSENKEMGGMNWFCTLYCSRCEREERKRVKYFCARLSQVPCKISRDGPFSFFTLLPNSDPVSELLDQVRGKDVYVEFYLLARLMEAAYTWVPVVATRSAYNTG